VLVLVTVVVIIMVVVVPMFIAVRVVMVMAIFMIAMILRVFLIVCVHHRPLLFQIAFDDVDDLFRGLYLVLRRLPPMVNHMLANMAFQNLSHERVDCPSTGGKIVKNN
jgi:hypothetical protein